MTEGLSIWKHQKQHPQAAKFGCAWPNHKKYTLQKSSVSRDFRKLFFQLIAQCFTAAGMIAPEANNLEEMDALHRYSPFPFRPENDWEK